jgi:hypothetical protein
MWWSNAGGTVDGRVVDAAGQPVPDASVILLERHFVMHNERQRTRSDDGGYFHFSGNDNHSLQLEAEATGLGRSERRVVRLWFRAQNVRLTEPLRLPIRLSMSPRAHDRAFRACAVGATS